MPRILLVEDNDANRVMLCRRLEQKGYALVPAESGERCLELAAADPPDLILMDIGLPGIDGHETTKRLKAGERTRHIPIIALSAHAQATDREKSLAAGCVEFESKPVQMPALLVKIEAALARPAPPPASDEDTGVFAAPKKHDPATTVTRPALVLPASVLAPSVPVGRKRILVVEDTEVNRVLLRRRLEKQGFDVTEAADGRIALDLVRRSVFDLVLLDIMMPEVGGYEVLEQLKADPDTAALPVIMISAIDEMSSVVRCIEAGAEDYLTKPYDAVLLQARINACLDKRRLRDQEVAYLKAVASLTTAAAAIEQGTFDPAALAGVSARNDELGRLARVFDRMAAQVVSRETQLRQEVERLKVEIDDARKKEQVAEITETTYFQDLQQKAANLRRRMKRGEDPGEPRQ
jgi:two-component system cell cycle response regulator